MARPPPSSSGPPHARNGPLSSRLDVRGLADTATLRATVVRLAAAVRCSGVTTAAVNACRAGTSILESEWRTDSRAAVTPKLGETGTARRSRLETKCGTSIVCRRPRRPAIAGASAWLSADSRFVAKNSRPSSVVEAPYRCWSQRARTACTANPPAKASTANSAARRSAGPAAGPRRSRLLVTCRAHRYGRDGARAARPPGRAGGRGRRSARRCRRRSRTPRPPARRGGAVPTRPRRGRRAPPPAGPSCCSGRRVRCGGRPGTSGRGSPVRPR